MFELYNNEKEIQNMPETSQSFRACKLRKGHFRISQTASESVTTTYTYETPYRKYIRDSINSRIEEEKEKNTDCNDIDIVYDFYKYTCPQKPSNNEWIVTFDESVLSNPKKLSKFIPLYRRLENLINSDIDNLLPSRTVENVVQFIEIVSPPITRRQIDDDYIANSLN